MDDPASSATPLAVRLYTDRYLIRGRLATTRERLVETLNRAGDFIVLEDVFFEEFDSREGVGQAPYVQVNVAMVVLASPDEAAEPAAEGQASPSRDQVLVGVPPYRITGRVELPNMQDLRAGIAALRQRFVQVTDAVYWSEVLNEPRSRVPLAAFNHDRVHIVAPFEERDVWAGVNDVTARRVDDSGEQLAEPVGAGVWVMDSDVGSLAPGET